MITYAVRRILIAIPLLWAVVTVVFVAVRLIPGDPVQAAIAGAHPSAQAIARQERVLGLDEPLPVQYLQYARNLIHLNFGNSYQSGQPIWGEIMQRWPYTVELAVAAMVLASLFGLISGVLAATLNRTPLGTIISGVAVLGISVPDFWLGTILALVFGVDLGLLPVSGTGGWRALVLPSVTLAVGISAILTRLIRATLVDVLGEDYIRTARAKGLRERMILYKHALRNALVPVATIYGLTIANLLGGVVIIENVFAWPGVGYYAVHAIAARDYPVIQGTTLFFAVILIAANLIVDLSYGFLDPRIRYG